MAAPVKSSTFVSSPSAPKTPTFDDDDPSDEDNVPFFGSKPKAAPPPRPAVNSVRDLHKLSNARLASGSSSNSGKHCPLPSSLLSSHLPSYSYTHSPHDECCLDHFLTSSCLHVEMFSLTAVAGILTVSFILCFDYNYVTFIALSLSLFVHGIFFPFPVFHPFSHCSHTSCVLWFSLSSLSSIYACMYKPKCLFFCHLSSSRYICFKDCPNM